jgi:hypothetical protein
MAAHHGNSGAGSLIDEYQFVLSFVLRGRWHSSTVDHIVRAVNGCDTVRCEEGGQLDNLFRLSGPSDRDAADYVHNCPTCRVLVYPLALRQRDDHAVGARCFDESRQIILTRTPCGPTSFASPLL